MDKSKRTHFAFTDRENLKGDVTALVEQNITFTSTVNGKEYLEAQVDPGAVGTWTMREGSAKQAIEHHSGLGVIRYVLKLRKLPLLWKVGSKTYFIPERIAQHVTVRPEWSGIQETEKQETE